jgi:hypothetical protein
MSGTLAGWPRVANRRRAADDGDRVKTRSRRVSIINLLGHCGDSGALAAIINIMSSEWQATFDLGRVNRTWIP